MDSSYIIPNLHAASTISHTLFIGQGATSLCYKVRYGNKWFLMKRLKPEYAGNPLYQEVFNKEFELGIQLDHPNIVRYLQKTDQDILMQYVDGIPLHEFIKIRPHYFQNKTNQKRFVAELISAVGYLHLYQILHLDLKPDNILITRQGNHLKIIDFGFAYQDGVHYHPGGTKNYAPPEQRSVSSEPSAASDIYAIGRLLHEMGIGPRRVIRKCMAVNPENRYQSVDELGRALKTYSRQWWYPAAAGLLAALFVAVFALSRPQETQLSEIDLFRNAVDSIFEPVDSLLCTRSEEGEEFAKTFKMLFDRCYQEAKKDKLVGKYLETSNNEYSDYLQINVFGFFRTIAENEYGSVVDTSGK